MNFKLEAGGYFLLVGRQRPPLAVAMTAKLFCLMATIATNECLTTVAMDTVHVDIYVLYMFICRYVCRGFDLRLYDYINTFDCIFD